MVVHFLSGALVVRSSSFIETVYPDGASCPADLTVADPSVTGFARELGYGADLRRMHFEHELSHTLLAEALGEPFSPTLRNVAVPGTAPPPRRAAEEALVFSFQRYLNTGVGDTLTTRVPDLRRIAARVRALSDEFLRAYPE